jgi:hypothetical protein
MIELARLLGGISALLLVAALATWLNLFRGPILRPIDGRARLSMAQTRRGSQYLGVATGVSAVAAVLAVAGFIAG